MDRALPSCAEEPDEQLPQGRPAETLQHCVRVRCEGYILESGGWMGRAVSSTFIVMLHIRQKALPQRRCWFGQCSFVPGFVDPAH